MFYFVCDENSRDETAEIRNLILRNYTAFSHKRIIRLVDSVKCRLQLILKILINKFKVSLSVNDICCKVVFTL